MKLAGAMAVELDCVSVFSSGNPEPHPENVAAAIRERRIQRRTTASLIKERLAGWRDWEMNPVLLKELRQAVRSQILTTMLLLLLAVLFLFSLGFLAREDVVSKAGPALGKPLFSSLLVILTGISMLFVPLYVGIRLAFERRKSNMDLMFFTAIPAGTMARGKFLCGAYLIAMFYSVCSPFMLFTNLLRGVDLLTILFILLCLYLVACLALQAAIFVACLPLQTAFEFLSGILFVVGLVGASFCVLRVFFGLLRSGVGTGLMFWFGSFMSWILILCGIGLLQVMTASLIATDRRPRGYYNEVIANGEVVP